MYRRVLCDWYLSDGIHKPLRLDAPQNVEEALSEAVAELYPMLELSFVDAGQEIYHWVIGIM